MSVLACSRIDLLALPSSYKHCIAKVIPEPHYDLPEYFPPGYELIKLNRKAPMINMPHTKSIYFRKCISKPLYHKENDVFDINDPYMNNISYPYEPLHDPALKRYFQQSQISKKLKKNGNLGRNNEVYCSLKEYNNYRRFLYDCHTNQIDKIRQIVDEREQDFRNVKYAIAESTHHEDPYKIRIQMAKEHFKQRKLGEEIKRREAYERSQIKRNIAVKRADQFITEISLRAHCLIENRRKQNEDKRNKFAETECYRKLLLNKCSALKSELAVKRKANAHYRISNEKSEREKKWRDVQFAWRLENQKYIQTLVLLNEEQCIKNIKEREQKIKAHREKLEHDIAVKSARQIHRLYESAEINSLVGKMLKLIRRLFKKEYVEKNNEMCLGLNDTPTVYELLTADAVRAAIESAYRCELQLKIPIANNWIIKESVSSLRHIAQGHANDRLHQDPLVFEYIRDELNRIIEEIKEKFIMDLSPCMDFKKAASISSRKRSKVSFGAGPSIILPSPTLSNNSFESILMRSCIGRPATPACSLATTIRFYVKTLKSDLEQGILQEMNTAEMFHFHDYQKYAVHQNLKRFRFYLRLKLEQEYNKYHPVCDNNIEYIDAGVKLKTMNAMIESVLTYAHQEMYFGKNILAISKVVWSNILGIIRYQERCRLLQTSTMPEII